MTVRLLHTADWQLGKPFANIPGVGRGLLREARFGAVRRIAALAAERKVDAVVVAGDAFDANDVADATLHKALQAMAGFAGPWVLLPGNHDCHLAECVWTRLARLGLPPSVVAAARPEPIGLLDGRLTLLPAPLAARRTLDDLTLWMDMAASPAAALRVGLAHGSVAGRLPGAADSDNPIAPDRAERARLDYLALGDWHGTIVDVAPRTCYAGTPEPDRFPQNDPGNVLLVELDGPGAPPRVERVSVAAYRWSTARLRLSADDDPASVVDRALGELADPPQSLVQLELEGEIGLAERAALDAALERWAARLCHLRVDDGGLVAAARPGDLAQIDDGGVIGAAARRLIERTTQGSPDERAEAALALRQLWQALGRVPAP
jgi:hypothetical protein